MGIKIRNTNEFKVRLAKNGFTQTEFAEKIGMSLTYMNKAINGERNIGVKAAGKMQQGLKAKFDELFVIEEA